MREYLTIITDIKTIMNSNNNKQQLKPLLQELYNSYKVEVTTAFLRGLVEITKDKKQKARIVLYCLKSNDLKTMTTFRTYKEYGTTKKQIETPVFYYMKNGQVGIRETLKINVGLDRLEHKRQLVKVIKPFL